MVRFRPLFHLLPPTHGVIAVDSQLATLSTDGGIAAAFRFSLSTRLTGARDPPIVARSMILWWLAWDGHFGIGRILHTRGC